MEDDNLFSGELSNPSDVVKELFSDKNPKTRTDLNPEQISIISRLYYFSKISGLKDINNLLDEFILLRISKDRKSRTEFVESFRLNDSANRQGSVFGNMMGMFKQQR